MNSILHRSLQCRVIVQNLKVQFRTIKTKKGSTRANSDIQSGVAVGALSTKHQSLWI